MLKFMCVYWVGASRHVLKILDNEILNFFLDPSMIDITVETTKFRNKNKSFVFIENVRLHAGRYSCGSQFQLLHKLMKLFTLTLLTVWPFPKFQKGMKLEFMTYLIRIIVYISSKK